MSENKENVTFEMREMKAELGLLSKSDGSAMFAQGICFELNKYIFHSSKRLFNF